MSSAANDEPVAEDVRRWTIPAIDGSSDSGYPTAAKLEALQKQAWEEAWQAGHAKGMESGLKDVQLRAERFDQLLTALSKPFDQLDENVENQLVELAMSVARQLFRREIKIDPSHIVGVVREAVGVLPMACNNIRVNLHPEDAALVEEALASTAGERLWKISEDPLIERGGCTVTTESSRVDAQTDTRLNAVISKIVGDERRQ